MEALILSAFLLPWYLWLGYETNWMTVRLMVGDLPRSQLKMTIAEWERYDKRHAKELEQARKEYAAKQAYLKSHTCPLCRTFDDNLLIEIKTISYGNSTCHITGCPDCLEKYRQKIEKSQSETKSMAKYKLQDQYKNERGFDHSNIGEIEILKDGKPIISVNGNYKRGMIRQAMKA